MTEISSYPSSGAIKKQTPGLSSGRLLLVCGNSGLLRKLSDAVRADIFALEIHYAVGIAAEYARWLIFVQHDIITVHIDFKRVFNVNVQSASKLNGQYYPSQLVNLSHDTCRFHEFSSVTKNVIFMTNFSARIISDEFIKSTIKCKYLIFGVFDISAYRDT